MNESTSPREPDRGLSTADLMRASKAPRESADGAGEVDLRGDGRAEEQREPQADTERPVALFTPELTQRFRARWDEVQIGFVDDPRRAVQQADELVAQVMSNLAESFAKERTQLESVVGGTPDGALTENLRVTLQRYRSFFQRLLSL